MTSSDPYDLQRFIDAQRASYTRAVNELKAGRKQSHWIWYIFPQIQGLGRSAMSQTWAPSARVHAAEDFFSRRVRWRDAHPGAAILTAQRVWAQTGKKENTMDCIHRTPPANRKPKAPRLLGISLLISLLAAGIAAAQEGKIEFRVLTSPPNLNISDSHSNAVIRSTRDWITWVGNLRQVPEDLPTVDFEQYTLLIANAGYKTNGPYEVKFDSITDMPNEIRVHLTVTGPAVCPAELEAGHYAAMAIIPRTDKPVQFDVTTRNSTCPRR